MVAAGPEAKNVVSPQTPGQGNVRRINAGVVARPRPTRSGGSLDCITAFASEYLRLIRFGLFPYRAQGSVYGKTAERQALDTWRRKVR